MKKESLGLLVILLVTLALRLGSFFAIHATHPERIIREDSPTYELPALALLQFGRFAPGVQALDQPETVRTPGYPAFIAAVYAVFGVSHRALIVAQILLSLGTIALVYAMGKMLWNARVALLCAALVALDPLAFLYSQQILTETLFTFLFTLGLFLGVLLIKKERPILFALLMSLAFILATFVRPVTYYLVLPLLLGLLIYYRWILRRPWHTVLAVLAAVVLPWILLIGGWQARNYHRAGSAEFSSIQGASLLLYRAAGVVALRDGITLEQAQDKLLKALPDMTGWSPARRYAAYRREGLALVRQYPLLCLKTQFAGLVSMLAGPGGSAFADYFNLHGRPDDTTVPSPSSSAPGRGQALLKPLRSVVSGYQLLFLALLYAGLLLAPWFLRKQKELRAPALFIGLVVAYLIAVSAGPEAYSRFRLPLIPAFALFSGAGFMAAWHHWRQPNPR